MTTNVWICFSHAAELPCRAAVVSINEAQESWVLHADFGFPEDDASASPHEPYLLASRIGASTANRPLIYVTHQPFSDSWFSHEFDDGISVISSFGFNRLQTGFDVSAYLLYQIAQSLIMSSIRKSEKDPLPSYPQPPDRLFKRSLFLQTRYPPWDGRCTAVFYMLRHATRHWYARHSITGHHPYFERSRKERHILQRRAIQRTNP